MTESETALPLLVSLMGAIIIAAVVIRSYLDRVGVPALVGYILLGFSLRVADVQLGFLSVRSREVLDFLASIGVITLLFRIGVESNISGLIRQLRRASVIWIGNVVFSAAIAYLACHFIVGLRLIPSLFVAVALTATSVGVSVGVWHGARALNSSTGELLVDVAELDDISSIILMALLFAVVPVLKHTMEASVVSVLSKTATLMLLKLIAFGALCAVLSLSLESRITSFFRKIQSPPEPMLIVAAIGFVMGALARLIGLSVAIGGFAAAQVASGEGG